MERAELLALVDAAPGDVPGLTAEVREVGSRGSLGMLGQLQPPRLHRGPQLIRSINLSGSPGESRWRVWYAGPDRWRIEGPDGRLLITAGDRAWDGSTSGLVEHDTPADLVDAGVLGPLVSPGVVLGLLRLVPGDDGEVAGRPCVLATGTTRPVVPLVRLPGERHELAVDAEFGIVLRHRVLDSVGHQLGLVEVTGLTVGPPDPAALAPPAGTPVTPAAAMPLDLPDMHGAPLEDRVAQAVPWGPPPDNPAAAEAAITATFAAYTETDPTGTDLVSIHEGADLARWGDRVALRYPGPSTMIVDTVRFLCPDEAAVWFTVEIAGRVPSPLVRERAGRAVCVDGRWLVERATFVDLVALAGVRVPPPG